MGKVGAFMAFVFLQLLSSSFNSALKLKHLRHTGNKNKGQKPAWVLLRVWQVAHSGARWLTLPYRALAGFVTFKQIQRPWKRLRQGRGFLIQLSKDA